MQEVETFGTEKTSQKTIRDFMQTLLDTSVEGILEGLDLRRPLYLPRVPIAILEEIIFPGRR